MAGTGAADVLSVNDLVDYARFRAKIQGARRVLIVGAGLIGCEFANDLIHGGIRPTVVDPAANPLSSFVPELAGRAVRHGLAVAGVD
jgi:rubredoxin-NAD+ reductase